MDINNIKDPGFLKQASIDQCQTLCEEIRAFLVEKVSKTGGHLSSNLGTVELTVALHKVFNSPDDKFFFDVSHQAYTHKILTGRAKDFDRLRQYQGLSGFMSRKESPHDFFEAGHAGTALSFAEGVAISQKLNKNKGQIVVVLGDGALTNGMVYEALNNLAALKTKVIIILNDNNMSISKNTGFVSETLSHVRISKSYTSFKKDMNRVFDQVGWLGRPLQSTLRGVRNLVRKSVISSNIFTDMGLKYLGPLNGHNLADLIKIFHYAKKQNGPLVIHLKTIKGKGYQPSEADSLGLWHGVSQFDPLTGESVNSLPKDRISFSELTNKALIELAKQDEKIVAISPAMVLGSGLTEFFESFPNRSFDTAITEEHAVTFAAGMAQGGYKPFVSLYSTFLQRAYDQINHDVARMNLPVVFGIDRAGLVGPDGSSHHGVFDIGILRPLPNAVIASPMDGEELQHLLYTGFCHHGPFFLRYPKGTCSYQMVKEFSMIPVGSWTLFKGQVADPKGVILTYGPEVGLYKQKIEENNLPYWLVNIRFIKPLDTNLLDQLFASHLPLFIVETDQVIGGVGEAIMAYKNEVSYTDRIYSFGLRDHYIDQGSLSQLKKQEGLDTQTVLSQIHDLVNGL